MERHDLFSNLGDLVELFSKDAPNDRAFSLGRRIWTRGEVAAQARVLASGWRAAGLASGDVVGIVGDTGPALLLALFSVARAGLVPLLIDTRLTPDERRVVMARAKPRALAIAGAPQPASEGLPTWVFDLDGCAALAARGVDQPPVHTSDVDAAAVLLVTSGTSGCPRVVALSGRNLSSSIRAGYDAHPCDRSEVFLSLLPATHAFELTNGLVGPLRCGASVVFPESRNPNHVLRLLLSARVTRINVVPAILKILMSELRDAPDAFALVRVLRRQLRSIVSGGAPTSPELVARMVKAGLPLWLGYGLTEASPSVATGPAATLPIGSTGRALSGVELCVDAATGELLVRGPNVMLGYVDDPAATAATVQDGWLHTGDVARLDDAGHVFIAGRLRDLIVTGAGLKLAPEDVEAAYRSTLFAEVCAVGVPDVAGGGGERPHLVVVGAADASSNDELLRSEFRKLSASAGTRRAYGLTILTTPLPRTRTFKLRRDLIKHVVAGQEVSA